MGKKIYVQQHITRLLEEVGRHCCSIHEMLMGAYTYVHTYIHFQKHDNMYVCT
jgi:hypothetical protein